MPTILVIEDDHNLLQGLIDVLEICGYQTLSAMSGHDGIEMTKNRHPDLVVCDFILADIAVIDLLAELRASSTTVNIPFIIISARADPQKLQKLESFGAVSCLVAPFEPQDLVDAIVNALNE